MQRFKVISEKKPIGKGRFYNLILGFTKDRMMFMTKDGFFLWVYGNFDTSLSMTKLVHKYIKEHPNYRLERSMTVKQFMNARMRQVFS